jgi:thioredoxin-dependent peroxiredoxin
MIESLSLPKFTLCDQDNKAFDFNKIKGKYLVLYFYPKDMTPGCTQEAKDFSIAHSKLCELGATVVGVSKDNAQSHLKFITKHDLPYQLLVDGEHKLAKHFGIFGEKSLYGRNYMGITRSTFLFDRGGALLKKWLNVKVTNHVAQVISFIERVV